MVLLVASFCVSVPMCVVSMPVHRLQSNDDDTHHRVLIPVLRTLQGRCVIVLVLCEQSVTGCRRYG